MQHRRFQRSLLGLIVFGVVVAGSLVPAAAHAQSGEPAVAKAIAWLHTQQQADGSFGFRRPDGTTVPDATVTADVIYALTLAGEDVTGQAWTVNGKTPLDALAVLAPAYVGTDAGQAGKVARAVALAGGNPRLFGGMDLVGIIRAAYDPGSGKYHPSFLFRHTLAVEALLRAGEPVPPAAIAALKSAQSADGGWFWAFGAPSSDVDTTGRVMQLLATAEGERCVPGMKRAVRYLAASQLAAGAWGVYPPPNPNPANGNSTGLAVAGLRAAGTDPVSAGFTRAGKSAWSHLLSFQEPSGAFVYIREAGKEEVRIMATVDALVALTQPVRAAQPCPTLFLPVILARKQPSRWSA